MEKYLEEYPPVLSVNEVAHILGISAKTVRQLIKTGDINSIRVGKLIKVPKNRLIDYLER
ncbi:helix-turn-helix domain-containing protein [Coprococcus catus]